MPKDSPDKDNPGVLLHQYLQGVWDSQDTTRSAWSRKVGIPDTTIFRWSTGVEPSVAVLRQVARALGISLVHLMLEVGLLDDAESDMRALRREVENERQRLQAQAGSIERAIETDTSISDGEREALTKLHEAFQAVASGRTRKARVKGHVKV